jgi:hypothetical protein
VAITQFKFDGSPVTESFTSSQDKVEFAADLVAGNNYFIQATSGSSWSISMYGPGGTLAATDPSGLHLIENGDPDAHTGQYTFTPTVSGEYHFSLGTSAGGVVGDDTFIGGITVDDDFDLLDTTTGESHHKAAEAYNGPVPGLLHEFIDVTGANINVTSKLANSFIHTGAGFDAIDVSSVNGDNVLDGGTGSNFLTGGSGRDTFFVDARDPTQTVWSTVANLHSGENATMWGLTREDFHITDLDNQGAVGFTGLTMVAHQDSRADAALTLAGYSTADLSNGRLQVSFGRTPDLPGLAGSNFMRIDVT